MLAESLRLVTVLKVLLNFLKEIVGCEDGCDVGMLGVSLISRVHIIILLCADWSPLLKSDKNLIEDLFGVDLNETAITIIGDTTSVVALSDQVLNGLPWNLTLLIINVGHVSDSTHVVGDGILANLVITIVEGVGNVPTKGLELLALSQHSVEPSETKNCLSEFAVSLTQRECLRLVTVQTHHVSLDTTWRLLSDL